MPSAAMPEGTFNRQSRSGVALEAVDGHYHRPRQGRAHYHHEKRYCSRSCHCQPPRGINASARHIAGKCVLGVSVAARLPFSFLPAFAGEKARVCLFRGRAGAEIDRQSYSRKTRRAGLRRISPGLRNDLSIRKGCEPDAFCTQLPSDSSAVLSGPVRGQCQDI